MTVLESCWLNWRGLTFFLEGSTRTSSFTRETSWISSYPRASSSGKLTISSFKATTTISLRRMLIIRVSYLQNSWWFLISISITPSRNCLIRAKTGFWISMEHRTTSWRRSRIPSSLRLWGASEPLSAPVDGYRSSQYKAAIFCEWVPYSTDTFLN